MSDARTAVGVVVHGRVQGVGFRYEASGEARRLGVTGWIRNEPDGTVAGHFEGDRDAVHAMVEWCRSGPGFAQIERVDTTEADHTGARGFDVRY